MNVTRALKHWAVDATSLGLMMLVGMATAMAETSPPSLPVAQTDAVDLPVVIVTARQHEEPAQAVPASLSVLDGSALSEQRARSVGDLSRLSANLQLGDLNGVRTVYIRGVGGGGRQVGFEPRTGIYVDGVLVSSPPSANGLLLDLDHVEVIRGPQGSLFGHNTVSGAVSLITREPGERTAFNLQTTLAGGEQLGVGAALDLPLAGPDLRLRTSASYARRGGYTLNIASGEHLDQGDDAAGRLRLLWLASDELRVDLSADLALQTSQFPTGEAVTNTFGNLPAVPPGPYRVALNTPQRDDNRNSGVAATATWIQGPVTLTSISAYRVAQRNWTIDLDYSTKDYNRLDYVDRYPRWSQELRLSREWPLRGLKGTLGLYYYDQEPHSDRSLLALSQIGEISRRLQPGDALFNQPDIHTRSLALFGTLGYQLSSVWIIDAGLRGTWVRQSLRLVSRASSGYQQIGVADVPLATDGNSQVSLSPDVALTHRFSPDARAYVRYARGVKDGGYDAEQLILPRTQPARFGAETVDSVELGLKSEWLRRRLRANAAVFYSEYRNYQVSQFRPAGSLVLPQTSNAGQVRIWGPELELATASAYGLGGQLSAAWLDAEYTDFKNGGGAGVDFSGHRLEFSPKWTGSATLDYRRALPFSFATLNTVRAAVQYSWRSDFFTQPSNLPTFKADSRSLLGLWLSLAQAEGHIELAFFADNLLGDDYVDAINRGTLGTLYVRRGDPRRYGMQLQARGG